MSLEKRIIAIDAMTAEAGHKTLNIAVKEYTARNPSAYIKLVGKPGELQNFGNNNIEIIPASQVIEKNDNMRQCLRKTDSSTHKTIELVKSGEADTGISFGRTDIVVALARNLERITGIHKTPIAVYLPCLGAESGKAESRYTLLLDVGAQIDCQPADLLQFAIIGGYFARQQQQKEIKVGLLNIGTEKLKGTQTLRDADELLKKYSLIDKEFSYIGFVEAWHVYVPKEGKKPDVIVCDGIRGNDIIKTSRGLSDFMRTVLKESFNKNIATKAGGLLWKIAGGYKHLEATAKPENYGAAYFLGLSRPFLKGHGSSNKEAMISAMQIAYEQISQNYNNTTKEKIALSMELCQKNGIPE